MAKYKKKPVVVEAFRFGMDPMPVWFLEAMDNGTVEFYVRSGAQPSHADIKTLEGVMQVNYLDYVIKGVKGELYPCKADIFDATYDKVIY